jgi:hypothetical protein
VELVGDGYKVDLRSVGLYVGNDGSADLATYIKAGTIAFADERYKSVAQAIGVHYDGTVAIGQKGIDYFNFVVEGDTGSFTSGDFKTLQTITLQCTALNNGTPITTANMGNYIPTNTNQLEGDFRTGANGAYVALANSSGNHFLATTEWVINYVTSKLG